jgi:hypothetical protein
MKNLKDIPAYRLDNCIAAEHIDSWDLKNSEDYREWISGYYFEFKYKKDLTLAKIGSFLGQEITNILSVKIAQRANEYNLETDFLFVVEKEDGSIEGSFAHCNYKMVWANIQAFVEYLNKGEEERSNLLGEEEHNRLCEEVEEA